MAKFLPTILNAKEPMFSAGLKKLEKSTGSAGVDVRLIADINAMAHQVMRKLRLDTKDTTAQELYQALMACVRNGKAEDLLINTDYVLYIIDGTVISLNLIDVIENSHHELPLENCVINHGQRSLCGELVGRYIDHVRTDIATTRQIFSMIGVLPDGDEWYNDYKDRHK